MTRPVYEPSYARTDRKLGFGADQLFRRPAPTGGSTIEWCKALSATNLGTSFTPLVFTNLTGNYDTTAPTFAINGDGNLEIGKDGIFDLNLWETGAVLASGVTTVEFLQAFRNSGADGEVIGSGGFTSPKQVNLLLRAAVPAVIDTGGLGIYPDWHTPLAIDLGEVAQNGAMEVQVECYHEEDGAGVATSAPTMRLFFVRHGDGFVPPP